MSTIKHGYKSKSIWMSVYQKFIYHLLALQRALVVMICYGTYFRTLFSDLHSSRFSKLFNCRKGKFENKGRKALDPEYKTSGSDKGQWKVTKTSRDVGTLRHMISGAFLLHVLCELHWWYCKNSEECCDTVAFIDWVKIESGGCGHIVVHGYIKSPWQS